jgi:hypothetical protein
VPRHGRTGTAELALQKLALQKLALQKLALQTRCRPAEGTHARAADHLAALPVTELKLDRVFVSAMTSSSRAASIVTSTLQPAGGQAGGTGKTRRELDAVATGRPVASSTSPSAKATRRPGLTTRPIAVRGPLVA